MKTHFCGDRSLVIGFVLSLALEFSHVTLMGQGTAFTYQGRLNDGSAPANGTYDLRFKLFTDPFGNNQTGGAVVTNGVPVAGGLFIVTLDFGAAPFNGTNYWLEIDVKTNGAASYANLNPLQAITPVPYALFAENAVGGGLAAGTYTNPVTLNNPANNFSGSFTGNGNGLTNVNASTLGGLSAGSFWKTAGNNGTLPGTNFVGTTDNQPLELWVNQSRAFRLEPATNNSGAPNVIGGAPNNVVAPGTIGATIAGGGATNSPVPNLVQANFGTIGGGSANSIQLSSIGSTIGGGQYNIIQTNASEATIAGGYNNNIAPAAAYSTISGGLQNTIQAIEFNANLGGYNSIIAGGLGNTIGTPYATISGGSYHSIGTNSNSGTVGGGYYNRIGNNTFDSTIGGGSYSSIGTNSFASTISGGSGNLIGNNATSSAIGGGYNNAVQSTAAYASLAGGYNNSVAGYAGVMGGGYLNTIQTGSSYGFLGGGYYNLMGSYAGAIGGGAANVVQNNSSYSFIGAGNGNNIASLSGYSVIGGGLTNNIQANSGYCVLGGGFHNTASGTGATIGGGYLNSALANYSTVPGGYSNTAAGQYSFAAGKRAQAANDGSFVWADSQDADFSSTAPNQFLIRAAGGVGIGTSDPQTALHIYAPQAAQLRLQDNTYGYYWNIYSESFSASGNLLFVPDFGLGGYISRASGNYFSLSDVRLKQEIMPLQGILERVLQLRPVSYHFRAESPNTPRTYGLIAQEVEPLFPEVVGECGGMKSLAYSELVPVTIGALQELNHKLTKKLEANQTEITELRRQNQSLEKRLERLERLINSQNGGTL